jgi:predicted O-methyltransferase YrrM
MSDALSTIAGPGYAFTRTWFKKNDETWGNIFDGLRPARVLEIGSYEGLSACWMIAKSRAIDVAGFEIHCVDSWEGGVEHQAGAGAYESKMSDVEARFHGNIARAKQDYGQGLEVVAHKNLSYLVLADLIAQRRLGYFDLIYVDGSHQAPDVLSDAVLSFPLLRVGGIMIFDDYLWAMEEKGSEDLLNMPKPAVDAFANLFMRKMNVIRGGTREQIYLRKHFD